MTRRQLFDCPHHGVVEGDHCVECEARRYISLRELGYVKEEKQEEEQALKSDPSEIAIRFRAWKLRQLKNGKRKDHFAGKWDHSVRIVRMYEDPDDHEDS